MTVSPSATTAGKVFPIFFSFTKTFTRYAQTAVQPAVTAINAKASAYRFQRPAACSSSRRRTSASVLSGSANSLSKRDETMRAPRDRPYLPALGGFFKSFCPAASSAVAGDELLLPGERVRHD